MRPYDHIVFQFSVHTVREPGASPQHFEFLATDGADPRRKFIESLCNALGESGNIVVYNETFESQRLSELTSWPPGFAGRTNSMVRGGLNQVERERIRKAVLDYCGQDTRAMVRLVEQLRLVSRSAGA
jgi:hypothetical protein